MVWKEDTFQHPGGNLDVYSFPPIYSHSRGSFESHDFCKYLCDSGGSNVATKGMVPRVFDSSGGRMSQAPLAEEPDGATPCKEVSRGSSVAVLHLQDRLL